MKALLIALALTSCAGTATADAMREYTPNVNFVITGDPCGEASLRLIYAVETKTQDTVSGCWFEVDGEVMARIKNGDKYQEYRFLRIEFREIKE